MLVCPSVMPMYCIKTGKDNYHQSFLLTWSPRYSSFSNLSDIRKFRSEPSQQGIKCPWVGEICNLFLPISHFMLEMAQDRPSLRLLWNVNRKSQVSNDYCQLQLPSKVGHDGPVFQWFSITPFVPSYHNVHSYHLTKVDHIYHIITVCACSDDSLFRFVK